MMKLRHYDPVYCTEEQWSI